MTGTLDTRPQFHLLFWYGVIAASALILGFFLAVDVGGITLLVGLMGWLILMPYHAQLSFTMAVVTFSSALILPFLPGRPFVWEFAAMLAWTGVLMSFALRRYPAEFGRTFAKHRWLYIGAVAYCGVLIVTMFVRGLGLRVLGTAQVGGRFYVQQLLCAVFPLLFAIVRTDERTLTRLFRLQWVLTATFLASDMAFSYAPRQLQWVLQFFEIPNDAMNFEMQNLRYGLRRFQSLAFFGQGWVFLMLLLFNMRHFLSWRGLILSPLTLGIFGLSLLSGHRWVFVTVVITVFFCAYAQRLFTPRNIIKSALVGIVLLVFTYAFSRDLPLAFQRSISWLPGISIDSQAQTDATVTLGVRSALRRIGFQMMPDYFWIGRGFARYMDDYSSFYDRTGVTFHVNQGAFYNGPIGLMVNTGVFGTLSMFVFMGAASLSAWRIIRHLRRYGCEDRFDRVCCVAASLWFANVIGFIFLHGDSEFAMKTFSLQAGMLLLCERLLSQRLAKLAAETTAPLPAPAAAPVSVLPAPMPA